MVVWLLSKVGHLDAAMTLSQDRKECAAHKTLTHGSKLWNKIHTWFICLNYFFVMVTYLSIKSLTSRKVYKLLSIHIILDIVEFLSNWNTVSLTFHILNLILPARLITTTIFKMISKNFMNWNYVSKDNITVMHFFHSTI